MSDPMRPPVSPHQHKTPLRPGPARPRASLRTAVVWEVLRDALDRRVKAAGREALDVLDTGGGSGNFAVPLAGLGHRVTVVDPSPNALFALERRAAEAGVADRVRIELCDYREARGSYDAVISVEMIEAVGAEFWPVYFRTLDERLAPGGRVALQAITMPHARMLAARDTHTWIQKYVFPGGLIPSTEAVEQTVREHTGLTVTARDALGAHYAETLRLWRQRFTERRDEVAALGFDAVFRRLWTFYLAYSEAGFRSGYLDVQQYLLTKEGSER
ncbi:class I SAM-dependent methyltransferase [Streptomyces seoulensis]